MTAVSEKNFFLVRHAESLVNLRFEGGRKNFESPLSPEGHIQSRRCAEFLLSCCNSPSLILTSPFRRCVTTAGEISKITGFPARLEPALHEFFMPEWFKSKKIRLPSLKKISSENSFLSEKYHEYEWWPSSGEDENALKLRMKFFSNRLLGGEFSGQTIICVGHWASIGALAKELVPDIEIKELSNAGVTKIISNGGKCAADFINETGFLKEREK